MKTSPAGVAFIAAHEGIVTRAYRDVAGVWTIGVGHTAAAGPPHPVAGMTMTRDQALALLAADLPAYERDVAAALGPVAEPVFDGAVSFHFNTGAIRRASWVKHYRAGFFDAAEASLRQWNKAGRKVYAGLVRRRGEEADLIFRGAWPRGGTGLPGSSDSAASMLAELGLLADTAANAGMIREAVRRFQGDNGLVVDGICGPATSAALKRAIAARRAARIIVGGAGAGAAAGGVVAADPRAAVAAEPAGIVLAALGWGALAALAAGLGFLAWRYRGVLIHRLRAAAKSFPSLLRRQT
jgi:lysozyme